VEKEEEKGIIRKAHGAFLLKASRPDITQELTSTSCRNEGSKMPRSVKKGPFVDEHLLKSQVLEERR
jgi:hypothetical protein